MPSRDADAISLLAFYECALVVHGSSCQRWVNRPHTFDTCAWALNVFCATLRRFSKHQTVTTPRCVRVRRRGGSLPFETGVMPIIKLCALWLAFSYDACWVGVTIRVWQRLYPIKRDWEFRVMLTGTQARIHMRDSQTLCYQEAHRLACWCLGVCLRCAERGRWSL